MPHGARGDRLAELDGALLCRPRVELMEGVDRLLGHAVEIVLVAADELDDDRFFGFEVVVEAPGQDACCVCDLFEGRPQSGGRKERSRGLEDLLSARSV